MKPLMKTKLLLIITLAILGLMSCDKEKVEPAVEIKIDVPTITVSTSEVSTASFTVNMSWTLTLTDAQAIPTWFVVDKTSGDAGTHTITLTITEANPSTTQPRIGYINIVAGGKTATITVIQPIGETTDVAPEIKIDVPTITVSASEVSTASFTVNMPWTLTLTDAQAIPTWFVVDKTSGDAGTHTITLTITEANPSTTQSRIGYINIVAGGKTATITVIQPIRLPTGLPDRDNEWW